MENKKNNWSSMLQSKLAAGLEAAEKFSVATGQKAFSPVTKDKDKREVWTGLIQEVEVIRDEVAPKTHRDDKKGRPQPIYPTPVPSLSKEAAVLKFLKAVFRFLFGIKKEE